MVTKVGNYEITATETGEISIRDPEPEGVVVLALDQGNVVMVRQYRKAVDQFTYELPGGGVKGGEELEAAARREFMEETGLVCGELVRLGRIHSHACLINRAVTLFFTSEILARQAQALDTDEAIEVLYCPLEEVKQNVANGAWIDSELVIGLHFAEIRGCI